MATGMDPPPAPGGAPPAPAGAGLEALGPLAGMWRSVYRKAGAAAELRAEARVEAHRLALHQPVALVFTLDGGGGFLDAAPEGFPILGPPAELPRAYEVLRWALYADAVGGAEFDLRYHAPGAYDPLAGASLCPADPPFMEAVAWAQSSLVAGWTPTRLPQGAVLVPVLTGCAGVKLLALHLRLRPL